VKFEKDVGLFPETSRDGWRGKKQFGATKKRPEEIKDMVIRA
jgi:hypothetical protein